MIGVLNIVVLEDQVKYRSFAKAIKALLDEDTLISISYYFISDVSELQWDATIFASDLL